jgi:hypothetical protein
MTVQASVTINFEADDAAAVQAVIDGLSGLPEGAHVSASVHEQLAVGVVSAQGAIEEPAFLSEDVHEAAAPEAT